MCLPTIVTGFEREDSEAIPRICRPQLAESYGYFGELRESPVFHVTAVC